MIDCDPECTRDMDGICDPACRERWADRIDAERAQARKRRREHLRRFLRGGGNGTGLIQWRGVAAGWRQGHDDRRRSENEVVSDGENVIGTGGMLFDKPPICKQCDYRDALHRL